MPGPYLNGECGAVSLEAHRLVWSGVLVGDTLPHHLPVLWRRELDGVLSDQLLEPVPEHLGNATVGVDDLAVLAQDYSLDDLLGENLEALFALPELLLGPLLLGDVVLDAEPVQSVAFFVPDERRLVVYPYHPPAAGDLTVLYPVRLAGLVGPLLFGEHPLSVIGMQHPEPVLLVEYLCLRWITEHGLVLRAHVRYGLRGVRVDGLLHVSDGRYLLHEAPETVLAPTERLLRPLALPPHLSLPELAPDGGAQPTHVLLGQ